MSPIIDVLLAVGFVGYFGVAFLWLWSNAMDAHGYDRKHHLRLAWLTPVWPFVVLWRVAQWLWELWEEAWL